MNSGKASPTFASAKEKGGATTQAAPPFIIFGCGCTAANFAAAQNRWSGASL
jgi:hypothetical protein